jgi:hypothetical protein
MINEINTVPNEEINKGREHVVYDLLQEFKPGFLFVFQVQQYTQMGFYGANQNSKSKRNQNKSYQLQVQISL